MVYKWKEEHTPLFLKHYKNYPCLWNFRLQSYKNRIERILAIESLIKDLNLDGVTEADIKLKIKSIRTRYTSELKKIKQSKINGNSEKVYVPRLYWFKIADTFLNDVATPRKTVPFVCSSAKPKMRYGLTRLEYPKRTQDEMEQEASDSASSDMERCKSNPSSVDNREGQEMLWMGDEEFTPLKKTLSTEEMNRLQSADVEEPSSSWNSNTNFKTNQPEGQAYRIVEDRLANIHQEDECDIIGKNVAAKLRFLPTMQKIFAEKIINDTLHEAQLNNLSRMSRLDNPT